MGVPRRTVLVGIAVTLAGCSGVTTGGDPGTDAKTGDTNDARMGNTTETGGTTTDTGPDETTAESVGCVPADVTRPAVPTDATVDGRSYPSLPATPTPESVTAFLSEFEQAFAWNRALGEYADVAGVRVQTLDPFEAVAGDDGVRATGRMRVFVVIDEGDGDRRVERDDYLVGYFVEERGVYRVETAAGQPDPQNSTDRQLVACREDGEN